MVKVTVENNNICFIWDCPPNADCKVEGEQLKRHLADLGLEVHEDVFHAMEGKEPVHFLRSV